MYLGGLRPLQTASLIVALPLIFVIALRLVVPQMVEGRRLGSLRSVSADWTYEGRTEWNSVFLSNRRCSKKRLGTSPSRRSHRSSQQMESEKRTARELIPKMRELGFYAIQYPEEYGGVGLPISST